MLMDKNLQLSAAQAITATAVSANYYDILNGLIATGAAYVQNATNYTIGNSSTFGSDMGIGLSGAGPARVVVNTGTGTPGAATSLTIQLQGAPDVTATSTYGGLTWTTYEATGAIPVASILASSRIATLWFPPRQVGLALPRFYQLNYVVAGSNFTGLTVSADLVIGAEQSQVTLGQYPANF